MVSVYCDTCSQRVEDGRDTVQAHVSFSIFNQFFTNNHFFINNSIPDFSLQRKDNDKASSCQRITNEIFFFRNLIPSLKLFFLVAIVMVAPSSSSPRHVLLSCGNSCGGF